MENVMAFGLIGD
jgi:hypothetical protein